MHEFSCRALETSACYDQIDIGALATCEILARQLQTAKDLLSHKFIDTRDDSNLDLFLMTGAQNKTELCICLALRAYLATETQKEAAILKERRKAKEERILAQPKKNTGRGQGGNG